jgi:predicted phosphodiesterase
MSLDLPTTTPIIGGMRYNDIKIDTKTAFIADVHGCHTLLIELLAKLDKMGVEKFVFLGDLVDRGPHPYEVVETVYKLVLEGRATVLMGNHDWKYIRVFDGKHPTMKEDQEETLYNVGEHRMEAFKNNYKGIFKDFNIFLIDADKKFVISHAIAMRPKKIYNMLNDPTKTLAKWFWTGFLYGKSDNTMDEDGYPHRLPITYDEHDDLDGWKCIVGHYHANELYLERGNKNVLCVDFCAGEGGKLAALTFTEEMLPVLTFSDGAV